MCLILSKSTTGVCVLSVIIICCFFVNVLKLVRQGFFLLIFLFFVLVKRESTSMLDLTFVGSCSLLCQNQFYSDLFLGLLSCKDRQFSISLAGV